MSESTIICDEGFLIDTQTGEVIDRCFELSKTEQDKALRHYSITPPVPYVPQKVIDRMKEKNKWLKGKDHYLKLQMKFSKKLKYIESLCGSKS